MMRDELKETGKGFVEQVVALAPSLPVADHRAQALDRFAKAGLPTTRVEAWRFTSLRGLDKLSLAPAPDAALVTVDAIPTALEAPGPRLVFVAGQFRADLSRTGELPDGVVLESLSATLRNGADALADGPFRALNDALSTDGAALRVAAGVKLAVPVELVFIAAGVEGKTPLWNPRITIDLADGAEATVVEHHVGSNEGAYVSNIAADIRVGTGARLHHYKLQAESLEAWHLANVVTHLAGGATYDTFVLNLGARLSRHEARQVLDGEGIEARVSGAYAIGGSQVSDITTLIDHAKPHCTSREVVKGVIDGNAKAVFQGKIIVRPDAQKTDGYQLNRALLLSDNAEINSKPELEIYADDVKCSHGATAGELDEDQMFYLRARGIPRDAARVLLIGAFLDEALEEIIDETVRTYFRARAEAWMGAR